MTQELTAPCFRKGGPLLLPHPSLLSVVVCFVCTQLGRPLHMSPVDGAWGPFLESPGNFSGPRSNIQIEI